MTARAIEINGATLHYRALPNAELAVCPNADHFTPVTPDGASRFTATIRDFAARH